MLLDEFGGKRDSDFYLSKKESSLCTLYITLENGEILVVTKPPFLAALILQQLPFTSDEYRAVSARVVWGDNGKHRWMY